MDSGKESVADAEFGLRTARQVRPFCGLQKRCQISQDAVFISTEKNGQPENPGENAQTHAGRPVTAFFLGYQIQPDEKTDDGQQYRRQITGHNKIVLQAGIRRRGVGWNGPTYRPHRAAHAFPAWPTPHCPLHLTVRLLPPASSLIEKKPRHQLLVYTDGLALAPEGSDNGKKPIYRSVLAL